MKISCEAKENMLKERRRKRIQNYFNIYPVGQKITLDGYFHKPKLDTHVLLAKHEHDRDYYFILQSKQSKVYLARLVFKGNSVSLTKIARTGEEYLAHKEFFDNWIKTAIEERENEKREFFEEEHKKYTPVAVRKTSHTDEDIAFYKFVSKHEHKGKYYFVVKSFEGEYLITKVDYFLYATLVRLTEKEKAKNNAIFSAWIKEEKKKQKKKKENE